MSSLEFSFFSYFYFFFFPISLVSPSLKNGKEMTPQELSKKGNNGSALLTIGSHGTNSFYSRLLPHVKLNASLFFSQVCIELLSGYQFIKFCFLYFVP